MPLSCSAEHPHCTFDLSLALLVRHVSYLNRKAPPPFEGRGLTIGEHA